MTVIIENKNNGNIDTKNNNLPEHQQQEGWERGGGEDTTSKTSFQSIMSNAKSFPSSIVWNNASLVLSTNISNNYNNIFILLSFLKFYAEGARNLIDIINKKVYGNCSSDLELSLRKRQKRRNKRIRKGKMLYKQMEWKKKRTLFLVVYVIWLLE